jgi:SAM-dependent methyltransferase
MKLSIEDYKISSNLDQTKKSYIYGEVYCDDIFKILKNYNLEYKNFLDIGSGNGKLLHYLSQNTELNIDGVEIDNQRYQKSVLLNSNNLKIEIFNESFEKLYFGNYDIIYCCNTVFDDDDNNILFSKILKEFSGLLLLFNYNHKLMHHLKYTNLIKTSWSNEVPIYIFDI